MWYYVTINGKYVVSPTYGEFALADEKGKTLFLWSTEQDARLDPRWQHLVKEGSKVVYRRTYT